jgi:hypothetical protein
MAEFYTSDMVGSIREFEAPTYWIIYYHSCIKLLNNHLMISMEVVVSISGSP